MEKAHLLKFSQWFRGYTGEIFDSLDEDNRKMVHFKMRHTQRVRKMIVQLAESNGLDRSQLLLANAIGLFHDIGRFPQWAMWSTFNDAVSANHGSFGAAILSDAEILQVLSPEEQNIILVAVQNHNARSLKTDLTEEETLFLKLIRDADKLDIFHVHANYRPGEDPCLDKMMKGGLPNEPTVSDEIVDQLLAGKIPSKRCVRTQSDAKLIVLGWVFDLSFSLCHQIVIENSIVDILCKALPSNQKIQDLKNLMLQHLKKHASDRFSIDRYPNWQPISAS